MELLPEKFVSKGHRHEMLMRTGESDAKQFAVYRRWSIATEWTTPTPHYEVIRIKRQEAGEVTRDGVTFQLEAKELYPNERTWGTDGWTFQSRDRAEQKYLALLKRAGKVKLE